MHTSNKTTAFEEIGNILEEYAAKGVFQGFNRGAVSGNKAAFRIVWHYNQVFDLSYDHGKSALRLHTVLPQLPATSPMYRDLKRFLKSSCDTALPAHRRIDPARATVKPYNRAGNVALTLKMLDGDSEYGVRKLIHLVHEIYLEFLSDGRYFDWLVETFELDPDNP
ncbi:MAG: hypothetical protein ACR2PS_01075 [Pseudomonadales bacterium]